MRRAIVSSVYDKIPKSNQLRSVPRRRATTLPITLYEAQSVVGQDKQQPLLFALVDEQGGGQRCRVERRAEQLNSPRLAPSCVGRQSAPLQ